MSKPTLVDLVRDQIMEEGPSDALTGEAEWNTYIDQELEFMSRTEFLERISAALEKRLSKSEPVVDRTPQCRCGDPDCPCDHG